MEPLASMTEDRKTSDLLAKCRNGDRDAIRDLYVEHQRRVYSIALNFFGGDADRAADVTQQVFLKLVVKMDFRGEAAVTTWLYRLTVNACIDETRRSRRFLNFDEWMGLKAASESDAVDTIEDGELARCVQKAVAKLKLKYRLPVILRYVEGLSYREISKVLGCSEGTVASRLNRGHAKLAGLLTNLRDRA